MRVVRNEHLHKLAGLRLRGDLRRMKNEACEVLRQRLTGQHARIHILHVFFLLCEL